MRVKILIVDDNLTIAKLIETILINRGYSVTTVNTAEKGLKEVQDTAFDLIIADLVLPGMDGWDFCKNIKSDDRTKDIPVIILTGVRTGVEDEIKSFELGAVDYLTKPFNTAVLIARIEANLQKATSKAPESSFESEESPDDKSENLDSSEEDSSQ